jgi:hypothetical protein
VGIVHLPHDPVDSDHVAVADASTVVDEASPEVLGEHFARQGTAQISVRPGRMMSVDVVHALEEERQPPDATFRHRDLEPRNALEHAGEDDVSDSLHAVHGGQRDRHLGWCVGRRDGK